jgi:hypothetical protein
MSALAGLVGLLPPDRIGVLSPHKKGSLSTEILISATLPIGPMPLAAPAFSGLWIGHPYISGQMNFLSRYCGGSVGGRIAGQINRCLRQGRAENPLMGDYCPNGFRPPAAPIVDKQEIEPGAMRSRHLSSCPISRTLWALSAAEQGDSKRIAQPGSLKKINPLGAKRHRQTGASGFSSIAVLCLRED